MRKFVLILVLALMTALPLLSLAETAPETEPASTPAVPWGRRRGKRWNQEPVTLKSKFIAAGKAGVCDNPGTDTQGRGRMQGRRGCGRGE